MSIEMVEQEDPSICIHYCWCLHYHFRVLIRFDLILKLILKIQFGCKQSRDVDFWCFRLHLVSILVLFWDHVTICARHVWI